MTPRPLEFHPAAQLEADSALEWYAVRSVIAARGFVEELDHALAQIQRNPDRWPSHRLGTRRYLLHRFPFLIIYRETNESIQIIAISHGRWRPTYWKKRT